MLAFAVHENAIDDFAGKIEALPVFFEAGHNSYSVRSVMKTGFAYFCQNFFATVPEWCVSEVVSERNGFGKVFVKVEATRNAAGGADHLKSVGKSGSEVVIGRRKEYLSFMLQSSK